MNTCVYIVPFVCLCAYMYKNLCVRYNTSHAIYCNTLLGMNAYI